MKKSLEILMPIKHFCEYINPLKHLYDFKIYIVTKDTLRDSVKPHTYSDQFIFDDDYLYFMLYFMDGYPKNGSIFYDGKHEAFCIEGTNGRDTMEDIEVLHLRVISRNPDPKVGSFFTSLMAKLQNDPDIAKGVYTEKGIEYKDIRYSRSVLMYKKPWFSLELRKQPIYQSNPINR